MNTDPVIRDADIEDGVLCEGCGVTATQEVVFVLPRRLGQPPIVVPCCASCGPDVVEFITAELAEGALLAERSAVS